MYTSTSIKVTTIKATTIKVTQRDGQVFEEKKSNEGNYTKEYKETVEIPDYLKKKKPLTKEEMKEHDDFVQLFDIENWYSDLEQITFQTYFIELSLKNAQKITELFQKQMQNEIRKEIENDSELMNICKQIDDIMSKYKMSNGCFCKLSSRSPKDATQTKMKEIFENKIKNENTETLRYKSMCFLLKTFVLMCLSP